MGAVTADSGRDGVAVTAAKSVQEQQRQNPFSEQRLHQAPCALPVFSGLTIAAITCERFERRGTERLGNWFKVTQPGRGYNPNPVRPPLGRHRVLQNGGSSGQGSSGQGGLPRPGWRPCLGNSFSALPEPPPGPPNSGLRSHPAQALPPSLWGFGFSSCRRRSQFAIAQLKTTSLRKAKIAQGLVTRTICP